jgi:hypothetical protein
MACPAGFLWMYCEVPLSKNEPAADWLPLKRAVFTFGVAADDMAIDHHDRPFDTLTDAEIAEIGTTPFSIRRLTRMLEEMSGATRAEIDLGMLAFSFFFVGNGSTLIGGPPWTILNGSGETAVNPDPRVAAEGIFNAEGFARIDDEQAARQSHRYRAVREASGLVWRQFMLRVFDRAVSTGAVVLYAQTGGVS